MNHEEPFWDGFNRDEEVCRLETALSNIEGQAVDWLSEPEVTGHRIPIDLALLDGYVREAQAPWMAGLEPEITDLHHWDNYWAPGRIADTDDEYRYQTEPDRSYFQADDAADAS